MINESFMYGFLDEIEKQAAFGRIKKALGGAALLGAACLGPGCASSPSKAPTTPKLSGGPVAMHVTKGEAKKPGVHVSPGTAEWLSGLRGGKKTTDTKGIKMAPRRWHTGRGKSHLE